MNKSIAVVLILTLVVFGFAACKNTPDNGSGSADTGCTCETGMDGGTTWCSDCNVGYITGVKVQCQGCYTAKTGGPACPTCKAK